jgi:V/A-type H+-transporting ATPase subunit D
MAAKRSLALAKTGYELMDKKRNILIREVMQLVDKANTIQDQIDEIFGNAYKSLQQANIFLGIINSIVESVPIDDGLQIRTKSIMGVEVPIVNLKDRDIGIPYGLTESAATLDNAYINFLKVKKLCATLAEIENSVYRLAVAIKKTQRRANALKNVILPKLESTIKYISGALEEKEREDFSRLKVIKAQKY